jgi:hypothetical protein
MSVVSVKIPDKTKREMEEFKDKVEWPSEIRAFIEARLDQARREDTLERVERMLKDQPKVRRGTASKLVREDRDSGH